MLFLIPLLVVFVGAALLVLGSVAIVGGVELWARYSARDTQAKWLTVNKR